MRWSNAYVHKSVICGMLYQNMMHRTSVTYVPMRLGVVRRKARDELSALAYSQTVTLLNTNVGLDSNNNTALMLLR